MDTSTRMIPLSSIVAGNNDRKTFDAAKLQELADNIRQNGLAQPPTLRPLPDGRYEIVAGERRTRACALLGWTEIPALVRPMSDETASAIMLAENMARADLDPVDEARAYDERMGRFGWTIEQVARAAGVSDEKVRAVLPVLRILPELQEFVKRGRFPTGYAAILGRVNLDSNRQRFAFRKWQANPGLGTAWFSAECAQLAAEQERETPGAALFDMAALMLSTTPDEALRVQLPPDPRTTKPPVMGSSPVEVMRAQIAWYTDVASQWDRLGKPNKRDQAAAKAEALQQMITDLGLDLLDSQQAAQALGVDVKTIHYHVRAGKLHPARCDGGYRFTQDEIDRFIAEGPRKPGRKPNTKG